MSQASSTHPSPMPSIGEILAVMAIQTRLLNPDVEANPEVFAAEVLAGDDTTRPLQDPEALFALALRQLHDRDFATIATMVLRANVPPPEETHAAHWRFHNAARALRDERGLGEWESLISIEAIRLELVARTMSPEELVTQLELLFRVPYRTTLNVLAFASKRDMTRMLNRVTVYSGPDMRRIPNERIELPAEDTATMAQLTVTETGQLAELYGTVARAIVQAGTQQVYAYWGESGYLAVKDRLTADHFIAQAQTVRTA